MAQEPDVMLERAAVSSVELHASESGVAER
jgi:hypothetical protein